MRTEIFENMADLHEYTDANIDVRFDSLSASLNRATVQFLIPAIGQEMFNDIATLADGSTPATITLTADGQQTLLAHTKAALGPLAMYVYIPRSEAMLTDAGVRRSGTDTAPGAYKYQVNALMDSYLNDGLDRLERLLVFMEQNSTQLASWQTAGERNRYNALLIQTGLELNNLFKLRRPSLIYRDVRHVMEIVQQFIITKELGQPFADLLAQSTFSDDELRMVHTVKKALAYLTMWQAVNEQAVTFDGNSITSLMASSTNQDEERRATASGQQLTAFQQHLRNTGYMLLSEAKKYLTPAPQPSEGRCSDLYPWMDNSRNGGTFSL